MIAASLLVQYLNPTPPSPTTETNANFYGPRSNSSSSVRLNPLRCDSYVRVLSPFVHYVE